MSNKARIAVAALTLSALGLSAWKSSEGFAPVAMIPTRNDVLTIGHGSTRYEDGSKVKMGDMITRERAAILARNLMTADEKRFAASLPSVKLHPEEFDEYMDFVGQYGIGNWRGSSMRRNLLTGDFVGACKSLLRYKFAAGYDCSTLVNGRPNKVCYGVWARQLERNKKCLEAQ